MKFRLILVLVSFFSSCCANAISIIRDDEIESAVMEIAAPIAKAAKIGGKLKLFIINDSTLNAFTAGGTEVFINSGLIAEFDDPSVLQGVIAHEIGHVLAGHVIQKKNQIEELQKAAAIGGVIGLVGGVLTGSPELALGSITGVSQLAQRKYLSYSRQYENEADRIALDLMKKAHVPTNGLITLLKKLMIDQKSFSNDPYMLTHPLGQWRIDHIKRNAAEITASSEFSGEKLTKYKRAILKLRAFTYPPDKILQQIKEDNFNSKYCRIIALFRKGNRALAEDEVVKLAQAYPTDSYLLEIKGQIFMESGKFKLASTIYEDAIKYDPRSNLLKFQLAVSKINQANIEKNASLYSHAIGLLNQIINSQDADVQVFQYLSVAYGRIGNIGQAKLALAEKAWLLGSKEDAQRFANQALKLLAINTPAHVRALDLLNDLKNLQ